MRFWKIWWGTWWWLEELCEVSGCRCWRGLRHHYPIYNDSYIFFKSMLFLFKNSCLDFPTTIFSTRPTPTYHPQTYPILALSMGLFFKLFFYCYPSQLSPFSLSLPPHLSYPYLPPLISPPLGFVHVSFIVVPVIPSSHCPDPTHPWLLLHCS